MHILILRQVLIDFGHLSLANTQSLNRKKTISEGQDSKAEMEGKECVGTVEPRLSGLVGTSVKSPDNRESG